MGILDEARALSSERPAHLVRCPVAHILASLDDKGRDELNAALADPDITGGSLARVLEARGHKITGEAIARHRRRAGGNGCRCPV